MADRLRDTASSHHRAFVVETMGRKSGYLALMTGIATGAELILTPESPVSPDKVIRSVHEALETGKSHFMVVVAEGSPVSAAEIVELLNEDGCYETRLSVLGHVQRGGPPLAFDRLLASRSAAVAVDSLLEGESGVIAGLSKGNITLVPTEEAIKPTVKVTPDLLRLGEELSH